MDFQVLIPWKEECQRRINETEHKEGKQYTFSSPFYACVEATGLAE